MHGLPRVERGSPRARPRVPAVEREQVARLRPAGRRRRDEDEGFPDGARRGRQESLGDYGDSKAALNDEFRRLAPTWAGRGVVAIVLHPGWVRTDMGGSSATLSVEESAAGIRELVAGLSETHHGRFWTWDGREHPW